MSHIEFWLKSAGDLGAMIEEEPYLYLVSADREEGGVAILCVLVGVTSTACTLGEAPGICFEEFDPEHPGTSLPALVAPSAVGFQD